MAALLRGDGAVKERIWLLFRKSKLVRRMYGWPLLAGPIRFASFVLVPAAGQKRLRVRTGPAKGLVFELNPRWDHPAWEGNYESDVQRQFVKFAKPGAVVYDIGANYGFFCLMGARAGADVIAFEPESENAATLARHAQLNALQNRIWIVPEAVFSHTGDVALEPPAQSGVHGNARANPESTLPTTVRVPCTTLDDFTASNPAPSLVKMDVEGGESDVLKGADRTFRVFRPVLLCEIHDDENARFAQDWLLTRGYDCSWLEDEAHFPKHLLARPREQALSFLG